MFHDGKLAIDDTLAYVIDIFTKFLWQDVEEILNFFIVEGSVYYFFEEDVKELAELIDVVNCNIVLALERERGNIFAVAFYHNTLKGVQFIESLLQSSSQLRYFHF